MLFEEGLLYFKIQNLTGSQSAITYLSQNLRAPKVFSSNLTGSQEPVEPLLTRVLRSNFLVGSCDLYDKIP